MVNPNDNNKSKEAAREENLQDVSSEQEDMSITTSPVSSPSSAPGKKQPKKKELDILAVVPSSPPRCYICKKLFRTWRAVFGHMRIHNKVEEVRENGVFPSPDFTPPGGASPEEEIDSNLEELAPVLLNIAQQVILESTRPDGLIIDLNQPGPSSPNQEESTRLFDLNEPPPREEKKKKKRRHSV
ncbi:hypothetical protein EZV62_014479 [Acer yangbiense]|uniref:C2H2-type domain-containing protein n=1 Tax=Acer yangbiense TaxID=1000413 RepID=A0A5C7HUC3_9ROSI|nr:hypothetical protein EZV62_014479 [Acer yangbiense]